MAFLCPIVIFFCCPQIPDQDAAMPSGWLEEEQEMIADPDAVKPDDWWEFFFISFNIRKILGLTFVYYASP